MSVNIERLLYADRGYICARCRVTPTARQDVARNKKETVQRASLCECETNHVVSVLLQINPTFQNVKFGMWKSMRVHYMNERPLKLTPHT